ncbi:polyketide cyclase [Mycobacterium sp. PS03-16]|uniref:SRPBCC family protein n=1 Tax=Mycobacterium sp. PS03-16 TaxID=2559611 RepID=UPI0010748C64|nr:SRPBCC family protein [Mycobacterium sp. PS03-16]TFV57882.1 polyketide cyclase [Mycobacterium sp. PS03-16]
MAEENLIAQIVVNAPAEAVFDVLADPSTHAAIDGTGWVQRALEGGPVTGAGQIFRVAMYHEGHPNKHYEMANLVEVFDKPRAIAWLPGTEPRHIPGRGDEDGPIEYGGWTWRYDLAPVDGGRTEVTLTYDWSRVPPDRRDIEFPPFDPQHLDNSLRHLAELAES